MLLGLALAAPATYGAIRKKFLESRVTILIISNEDKKDIVKIVKSLQ